MNVLERPMRFRSLFLSFIPAPLRALRWRIHWLVGTDYYKTRPFYALAKPIQFSTKEFLSKELSFSMPCGLNFVSMPNNFSSFAVAVVGSRDPNIWKFIQKTIKEGDIFIDIGANVGAYSLPVARLVGQNGKV